MSRMLSWAAALVVVSTGCAIEGPPDDDEGDTSPEAVGDPAYHPGVPQDPSEDEPGPEGGGGTDAPPPADGQAPTQACYLGSDGSHTTCLPLVAHAPSFPAAYIYPLSSDPAYQAPLRYIDLDAVSPSTALAPSFVLGELMQAHKGRYGVFRPHVVDKLQSMRDQSGGALLVHSGYRSPGYNATVDGATFSRHIYGDGVDMHSAVLSLNAMKTLCDAHGADFVSVYATHVHCDWRYTSDAAFFAPPPSAADTPSSDDDAYLAIDGDAWTATAAGFDEGEPYREWTAFDRRARALETIAGDRYRPIAGAAFVEVVIGGRIGLRADVDDPRRVTRMDRAALALRLDTLSQLP